MSRVTPGRRGSGRQVAVEVPHRPPRRRAGPVPPDHRLLPRRDQTAAHLVPRRAGNPTREAAPLRPRPGSGTRVPGLAANRTRQLASDPQPAPRRHQVARPVHRDRAARVPRPSHPDPRDQAEEDPGHRHGLPHRRRGQSPPGRTRPGHPPRAARHRPALHALRHRRPRPRDLRPEHRRCPHSPPDGDHAARQRLQNQARPADGPHSPTDRRTTSTAALPTAASAQTATRCSTDPNRPD